MRIRSQLLLWIGGVAVPLIVFAMIAAVIAIRREQTAIENGLQNTAGIR
jgi:hypothetical protein